MRFLLTEKPRAEPRNETLAKHLYHHGEQFLEYLNDPTVPATNHRAEQALKTPIVNRKVWGGNRTEAGAEAQSVVSSVLQTCKGKAIDMFAYVSAGLPRRPRRTLALTQGAKQAQPHGVAWEDVADWKSRRTRDQQISDRCKGLQRFGNCLARRGLDRTLVVA